MLDAETISFVTQMYRPERAALVGLLGGLGPDEWAAPTECPVYDVKGIAAHVLGDDFSLLSRQRDGAIPGVFHTAVDLPGADFPTLLDAFNDQWVSAARFMSPELLIALLELTEEWTARYYEDVDPAAPGEPVGLFGPPGPSSPLGHAIAREYMERWCHHSQIRRALGMTSVDARPLLTAGVMVAAAIAGTEAGIPAEAHGDWSLGPVLLGDAAQAAAILTRGLRADEIRSVVSGPADGVDQLASFAGRPMA